VSSSVVSERLTAHNALNNFRDGILCFFRNNGFRFVRLDGSMTSKQRTTAIEAFSDPDTNSPTVFLLSLKAGGVGINLTAACRIFLMDPASFANLVQLGLFKPVIFSTGADICLSARGLVPG
jgi:hypothetical protein